MVYYFTSNVVDPPATIYVGKDKFESLLFPISFPLLFSCPTHFVVVGDGGLERQNKEGEKSLLEEVLLSIY